MSILDHMRSGTFHDDQVAHIENVCVDLGYHSHDNGDVQDVTPAGIVIETPGYFGYGFTVKPRAQAKFAASSKQFANELRVDAVRVECVRGVFFVQVLRETPETIYYDGVMGMDKSPLLPGEVLLGLTGENEQLTLHLPAPRRTHAIVIGMTGSGKTNLFRVMALSALENGTRVALFDPRRELAPLSGHPLVWRGGSFHTPADCERALAILARDIDTRHNTPMLIFVDEVPDLIATQPRIQDHLARLAQSGRHASYHLVLGAQHALTSTLGSETLRNMPVRIIGRVADPQESYNASGRSELGAEALAGSGDFILVSGEIRRFQAPFLTDKILAAFHRQYGARPPRLPTIHSGKVAEIKSHGVVGRPTEDPEAAVINLVRDFIAREGEPPSLNWVYRKSKAIVPSGGYGRDKAQRAIDAAKEAA